MRPELQLALTQMLESQSFWEKAVVSLMPAENIGGHGISAQEISRSFDETLMQLRALAEAEKIDAVAWSQLKASFISVPNAALQFFTQYWSNPQQVVANIPSICSWLWSLRSSILLLMPVNPLATRQSPAYQRAMAAKIAAVEGWLQTTEGMKDTLAAVVEEARSTQAEAVSHAQAVTLAEKDAATTLKSIESIEREIATAKTNAEAAAVNATAEYSSVKKQVLELAGCIEEKDALFKEFEGRRDEISGLLENANKVGLARAFQLRRVDLGTTWKVWAGLFSLGIIVLLLIGFFQLLPLLKDGEPSLEAILVRTLLASPIVWFTWFASRQYSHALRVGEDYAFKEAAAMAYAGYRNEVTDDEDMLKLLQEAAIKNYGANPTRILLKNSEPASPVHDLLDKALEKLKPAEIIEALSSAIKNAK
jgi:hypothetical protein